MVTYVPFRLRSPSPAHTSAEEQGPVFQHQRGSLWSQSHPEGYTATSGAESMLRTYGKTNTTPRPGLPQPRLRTPGHGDPGQLPVGPALPIARLSLLPSTMSSSTGPPSTGPETWQNPVVPHTATTLQEGRCGEGPALGTARPDCGSETPHLHARLPPAADLLSLSRMSRAILCRCWAMHTRTYAHTCIYASVHVCVCAHACAHIYTYIRHTHASTHPYVPT